MSESVLSQGLSSHIASFPLPTVVPAPAVPIASVLPNLRVLHVINGEHFSGAERVQQLLGRQLPSLGIEAQFACLKPGKFSAMSGLPEANVFDVAMRGRLDLGVVTKLGQIVAERGIDILHAHTPRTALITSLLAMRTGLPWVYHVHSPTARDSTRGLVNRINRLIEGHALRNCQQVLTVSRSLRREMLRLGIPRRRLAVVPNGVPAIEPIDAASRIDHGSWHVGLIALMRPRKGVEIALEAMKLLQQRNTPITLELIGGFETDSYQQQILQRLEQLGLDHCVQCSGFTRDVPSAIRRLDALLLPSLFGEGMPMVVLEALSAAVPVVATEVEGTPEVVRQGVEGYLAKPGSASSLATQLELLTSDRRKWAAMSQRALARHRACFSDHRMAQRVTKSYAKVFTHRSSRS